MFQDSQFTAGSPLHPPCASTNTLTQWALLLPPYLTIEGVGRATTPILVYKHWWSKSTKSTTKWPTSSHSLILPFVIFYTPLLSNNECTTFLYGLSMYNDGRSENFTLLLAKCRWSKSVPSPTKFRSYLRPSPSRSNQKEKGEWPHSNRRWPRTKPPCIHSVPTHNCFNKLPTFPRHLPTPCDDFCLTVFLSRHSPCRCSRHFYHCLLQYSYEDDTFKRKVCVACEKQLECKVLSLSNKGDYNWCHWFQRSGQQKWFWYASS